VCYRVSPDDDTSDMLHSDVSHLQLVSSTDSSDGAPVGPVASEGLTSLVVNFPHLSPVDLALSKGMGSVSLDPSKVNVTEGLGTMSESSNSLLQPLGLTNVLLFNGSASSDEHSECFLGVSVSNGSNSGSSSSFPSSESGCSQSLSYAGFHFLISS